MTSEIPFIETGSYKDLEGREHTYRRLSLKRQLQLLKVLAKAFQTLKGNPDFEKINFTNMSVQDLISILPSVFDSIPDRLVEMTSIIVEKDPEWLSDNVSLETCVEVVVPFLQRQFRSFGKLLPKVPEAEKPAPPSSA